MKLAATAALLSTAALSCEAFVAYSGAAVPRGVTAGSVSGCSGGVNVVQGAIMSQQDTLTGHGDAAGFVAASRVVLFVAAAGLGATSARQWPGARRGGILRRRAKDSTAWKEETALRRFISRVINASRPFVSKVITEIRMMSPGRRKELELNLLEAQKLTAQAEKRAETLETMLEAELKEERQKKEDLSKQIKTLQAEYNSIAEKFELQEKETTARLDSVSKLLEETTATLTESRKEAKEMELENENLKSTLEEKEKELTESVRAKENMREEVSEEFEARIEAKDAEYQSMLKELQAKNEENKLLEETSQAAESRLEELPSEKTASGEREEVAPSKGASSKGAGKKKGKGKGKSS